MGIAVRAPDGEFVLLTGNQIGRPADLVHLRALRKSAGKFPKQRGAWSRRSSPAT